MFGKFINFFNKHGEVSHTLKVNFEVLNFERAFKLKNFQLYYSISNYLILCA